MTLQTYTAQNLTNKNDSYNVVAETTNKPKLLDEVRNKLRSERYIKSRIINYLMGLICSVTNGGKDIRTIQELIRNNSVKTKIIYTHVLKRGLGVKSPLN